MIRLLVPWSSAAAAFGAAWWVWREARELRRLVREERILRLEERRGRTRAEVSLRNLKKQALSPPEGLVVRRIGVVRSPFVKRAGTPRQGLVCPSSRGKVVLQRGGNVVAAALDGLDRYSHAWLLFEFHANTDDPTRRVASKVCPPRGYGERVGWLATRSPHRTNPVGLSLVSIEGVDLEKLEIMISALDLCDGTPIFDIKPYVPWDAPPQCRVPEWVDADDALARCSWTPEADEGLRRHSELLGEFYANDVTAARRTITELLLQDPRNKRRRNARKRGGGNESTSEAYAICFAHVQIQFAVANNEATVLDVEEAPQDDDRLRLSSSSALG